MQNPLKMLGDMNAMRKSAMLIQQSLEKEEFDIHEGNVHVVMTGTQVIKLIEIDGVASEAVKRAVNNAIKRSQEASAAKMQEMMKGMNM